MGSSKRTVRKILVGAVVAAMGVTTLFAHAGSSYAAGEATLNKTSRNILTRQTYDFDVTGAPSDAVITWKSSDETIAAVDENGVVTGIKKGAATITCEVTSAGKTQTLTAKVQIRKPALKIEINNKVSELKYGEKVDLNRTLTPKTSNDVTTWKSSDTKIATVDANGVVKGLKDGTVTITATTMSGKSDSVEITVYGAPAPTKAPEATATPVPTKTPGKPTPTPKPGQSGTIYEESFEKSAGLWAGRAATLGTKSSVASPDGTKYLEISGRSSSWNGAGINLNKLVEVGGVYKVSAYVKQDAADGEIIRLTWDKNHGEEYIAVSTAEPKKGEWTLIEGTFEVKEETTDIVLYFEADNATMNIGLDAVKITEVSGGTRLVSKPADGGSQTAPDGSLVYKFASMKPNGYGYKAENTADGGVKVTFEGQYQEVFYMLPEDVDLAKFDKVIFSLETATGKDAVALKICAPDAELDAYNNPTPMEIRWGVTTSGVQNIEMDLSAHAKKDVNRIGIMSNDGAANITLYSITFVPKK